MVAIIIPIFTFQGCKVNLKKCSIVAGKVACLPLLLAPAVSFAAQDDAYEDTMVVTASGIEQTIKNAPASVSVITAEELQSNVAKSATDLADILSQAAGVSKAIGNDVGSGIQIRGMPAAYTLLLVDGKRVGSSNGIKTTQQNYFDDINWIPIESIERIEIVRGPMSSLYGSDAMGGVVNIITKKNVKEWNGSLTMGTEIPQESKHGETNTYTAVLGGPLGNGFSVKMNGSWSKRAADESNAADFDKNGNAINGLRWGRGREGKKRTNFGADLAWQMNDNHRMTIGFMRGKEEGLEGTVSENGRKYSVPLRGISELERKNYSFDYQGLLNFGTVKFAAYQNKYENFSEGIPVISNNAISGERSGMLWSKDTVVEGDINIPFDLLLPHSLTLGAQWKKEELDNPSSMGAEPRSGTLGQTYGKVKSQGLFLEDQISLLDDLTLTLGLRYDDTDYGEATTPRAYLVYQPTDSWTFKGGYSEGFKVPTIRQASLSFVETSRGTSCQPFDGYLGKSTPERENIVDCFTRGNANLKPEKSQNWEIGGLYDNSGWQVGLTFFDSRFKDKIATSALGYLYGQTGNDPDDIFWLQRTNLDTARTQGIEATLNIPLIQERQGPWLNKLTLRNNFTRMTKAEDSSGNNLTTSSKFTSYSSLDWDINEKATASLNAQYYGRMLGGCDVVGRNTGTARICNPYMIWGLNGQYKATKNVRLNAGIDNLFDKNPTKTTSSGGYSSTTGNNYFVPGRTFFGSVTVSF
ncbi:TonB-dependent receptor [Pectobacterium cacticida]|uniref:TonB-dependent receptor domain-containing protein n=1 Tax=Pectobacterium cacticida TaxID=69221 RepID=UPI002FF3A93A